MASLSSRISLPKSFVDNEPGRKRQNVKVTESDATHPPILLNPALRCSEGSISISWCPYGEGCIGWLQYITLGLWKGMLVFDVAQFDGILKKVSEFNNALLSDPEKSHLSLTEGDMSKLGTIAKILKDTSHYHSSTFSDLGVALIVKLLKHGHLQ